MFNIGIALLFWWSDGDKLLFNSDRGGINAVWVADFDGDSLADPRNLNDGTGNTINGANWMPDGDWILARGTQNRTVSRAVSNNSNINGARTSSLAGEIPLPGNDGNSSSSLLV